VTTEIGLEVGIVVNGERRSVRTGATLLDLVGSLGLEPERVAVELDRQIVKRDRWGETAVEPGAQVEIVQFVGGG
jgi:thiamine biosynthesis protein ThiS